MSDLSHNVWENFLVFKFIFLRKNDGSEKIWNLFGPALPRKYKPPLSISNPEFQQYSASTFNFT